MNHYMMMSSAAINDQRIILQSLEGRLRLAASKGHNEEVQHLLREGATFEGDREGRTPLHYSAQNGHLETCKILIRNGCNTDFADVLGYTPLHRCVAQGHLEITDLLLSEGCLVDVQDQHGNTPLHEAAWNGYSKSIEVLVKNNCNVHIANKAGFTALHLASQAGHNESSRVILYAGCNTDVKNNYGDTALHTAARYGHAGVTRILISARSRLNEQNKNGDTALHITAALQRRKIAKLLVEGHIDVTVRNKQNETAVDVAKRKEHPEIILIITSLSSIPKSHRHSSREREMSPAQVVFKDEIDIIDGPVIVPEDQPPLKSEQKEEKKRFFFFKKKKKDKEKSKTPPIEKSSIRHPNVDPRKKVEGFFSQYVPKQGVQYYRDLAGNIKQGPIGYSPSCQCAPNVKKLEHDFQKTTGNLYEHIDASHKILSERIDHLDQRTTQQVYAIDKLTKERLDQERQACENRITEKIEEEWSGNKNVLVQYNKQIQTWLDDKMESYGHCLDHHHDDSALPSRNILFDFHQTANGRLFKSRSDETLSDCSGKNRKRDFYESRQAAMRQIRGWSVPSQNDGKEQREKNNNHISVTQAQVHPTKNSNMDRRADGASPKYSENPNTIYHDFRHSSGVRNKDKTNEVVPKQTASHQQWSRPLDSVRPSTSRPSQSSHPFDSHLYRSIHRNQTDNNNRHRSNLVEGGVPNQNNNSTGVRDASPSAIYNDTGTYNSKNYDLNRNYQSSAYSSQPLTPNYRLAKSSDFLHDDMEPYTSGIQRSKSVERTLDNMETNKSPNRKSVTFMDRVSNRTPIPLENEYKTVIPSNNGIIHDKIENPYSSVNEIRKQNGLPTDSYSLSTSKPNRSFLEPNRTSLITSRPLETNRTELKPQMDATLYKSVDTKLVPDSYRLSQHHGSQNIYNSARNVSKPPFKTSESYINSYDYNKPSSTPTDNNVLLNGAISPMHTTPSSFIPFAHSSPGQAYNAIYNNKEDSTCSSNPDSGYSSKGLGQGTQSVSGTPSSSFSADRSLSIGTPSNSNSPCLPTNPIDYTFPKLSQQSNQQNTGWYQRKLLEAAEKMRKTSQYNDIETTESAYNNLYVSLNYDPVHGSDV